MKHAHTRMPDLTGAWGGLGLLALAVVAAAASADTITTVAGTGKEGFAGDGGKATAALLAQPFHCDLDGKEHLYIAEAGNHCVRRVNLRTGVITTVAGTGTRGYTGDKGPAVKATLNEPYAVAVTAGGDLFIVDRLNAVVRRVAGQTGTITTVAGTGKKGYAGDGGPGTEALLTEPNDCCLDGKGGLLIADVADCRVRRLDLTTGVITTFAGTGRPKGKIDRKAIGDGGPASKAVLVGARAVCVDGRGNTYICEREGNAIRRVAADGTITTLAGTGARGSADGPAERATFNGPKAIRCDREGNVFVVDTENHSIRKLDVKALRASTVAGGRKGSGGDGGDALQAGLDRPHGCVIDSGGRIYIADSNNHRVRLVSPAP
jgi:sugar lactone lactonase YvrE